MTTRLAVASLLAVACSSSKHDPPPAKAADPAAAPAPAPPKPLGAGLDLHGVTVQVEGDHTAVIDPVGGLRLDLPGTPELESNASTVTATLSTNDSDLIVTIARRAPGEVPRNVDKAYEQTVAAGAKHGLTTIDQRSVTLAGLDGYYSMASDVDQDGHLALVRLWQLEVTDKATAYQILLRTPGPDDPPAAWMHVPATLRAAP